MPDSRKRFDRAEADLLRQKYIAGEISEAEAERLLIFLRERPEEARALLDQLSLDAMLRELGKSGALPMPENVVVLPQEVSRVRLAIAGWAALAACVAVLATLGVQYWHAGRAESLAEGGVQEATTRAVAVLRRAVNAQWADEQGTRTAGTLLEPGLLQLKSGLVQVEFFTGARVLLEGPAELRLISAGEAFCTAGKLSAAVPPQARGFRIGTPQGVVVDLGTEFGLNVDGSGAEVHVMKGEVELHRGGDVHRSLREGQAVALVPGGAVRELPANAAVFADRSEVEQRARDLQRAQMERWRLAADRWNYDPSLLVRFDFEPQDAGAPTLKNVAMPGGRPSPVADAAIVGCSWTQGRWPGKRALEFRGVGDRARLEIPGELSTVTLAAWVRVDGLDRQFNSLFMCEGFSPGDLHWQIDRRGFARLGIAGEGDRDSPVLFTPERYGQWVHLAVVYDSPKGEVRHYADGQLVARRPLEKRPTLRLGMAELGNWSPGAVANSSNIRHFSGAMDEFVLFSRALSDEEIRSMYSAGIPDGGAAERVASYVVAR